MKTKAITGIMFLFLLSSLFAVVPVFAIGPTKSNGENVVNLHPNATVEWWIIFTKTGWRQWADTDGDGEVDRFAIVLYKDNMNPKAIVAKLTKGGWKEYTIPASDVRHPLVASYDIIYKSHDIPVGPP